MANNYTLFSIALDITPEQAAWLTQVFTALREETTDFPEGFTAEVLDNPDAPCVLQIDGSTAYLYADDSGDFDGLAQLLHAFLAHFNLDQGIGLEAAFACSKPRPGEFGGAAAWITKDNVEFMGTGPWLATKMSG